MIQCLVVSCRIHTNAILFCFFLLSLHEFLVPIIAVGGGDFGCDGIGTTALGGQLHQFFDFPPVALVDSLADDAARITFRPRLKSFLMMPALFLGLKKSTPHERRMVEEFRVRGFDDHCIVVRRGRPRRQRRRRSANTRFSLFIATSRNP